MQDPMTAIDLGHSGAPDAVATPWEETRRVLETAEIYWLATVRTDGRPHVTPIKPAWLDGTLYISTGSIAQKLKNLRRNPHVALTTGCNRMEPALDIVVEGDVIPVTDAAVHAGLYQTWLIQWGEGWPITLRNGILHDEHGEPLLVFSVTLTKVFAYARGDQWSQTRYQF